MSSYQIKITYITFYLFSQLGNKINIFIWTLLGIEPSTALYPLSYTDQALQLKPIA